ncbi:molybdenum cofactor guanylyltransferase [Candidatus Poribacteria bacterium]|nr:molybdenum cofactor guanylyltransferase [Candidatus Poribacteria bacterium]
MSLNVQQHRLVRSSAIHCASDRALNLSEKLSPVTGVILAGGQSRRMGENKALMPLGDDALIGHVIRRMRLITDELLLITNTPTEYANLGVSMHGDIFPDTGALGGIYTGLMHASHDAVLCVACDSPFLNPNLLAYLVSVLGEYDAVMPYTYSRNKDIGVTNPFHSTHQITLQTLCAAYSKRCLPIIESMLRESELRVHALAERAHIKRISPEIWQKFDPDGRSFFNINTPEDFERADSYMRMQTTH